MAALVGCGPNLHASGMSSGKLQEPLPEGCPVKFENVGFQEAQAKFEQVGMVTLTGTDESYTAFWKGKTKKELWPKVCKLGGTIVTPNGAMAGESVMGVGTGMIQFMVWRER